MRRTSTIGKLPSFIAITLVLSCLLTMVDGKCFAQSTATIYKNAGDKFLSVLHLDYDKAIEWYSLAIQHDPNYVAAYSGRGEAYRSKGLYDKAIEDLSQAIKLNPEYYPAYYSRGQAYLSRRKTKDTTDDKLLKDITEALRSIDYQMAIRDFTEVIRLCPDYETAYSNRGEAYEGKKEFSKALADYKEALRVGSSRENLRDINREIHLKDIRRVIDKMGTPQAKAENDKLSRLELRRSIINIEAKIPEADKKDAENARYNDTERQKMKQRIDELDAQAVEYAKNKEFLKAAGVQALSLTIDGQLRDGSYKKDTGAGAKLRQQLAELKKQLLDLEDDK